MKYGKSRWNDTGGEDDEDDESDWADLNVVSSARGKDVGIVAFGRRRAERDYELDLFQGVVGGREGEVQGMVRGQAPWEGLSDRVV